MSVLLWLLAPVALALSRLLPAHGLGLGLRLAAAVACLLLPGALVSRALGVRGFAGAFASPDRTLILSFTPARGDRMGESSKPAPSACGVNAGMCMPFGT